jgi:cell division protein FtsA
MLVGIDVGSHKICTLIGEDLSAGAVRVLGVGHAPSVGVRAGEIVHVDDAAGAIAASVERAERIAGVTVDRAYVGISSPGLLGANNRGLLPFGRRPRPVDPGDVARALEVAGTVPVDADRAVLHVLPRYFTVDNGVPVISPLNMEGHRLQAEVHIVTAPAAALGNLRRCLAMAEITPAALVMSTLAAGGAVLTPDERELGCFLVDLGAATTAVACYVEGALAHTAVLPVGGRHMTNDLGVMLQTPLAEAERLKTAHGHALPELDDDTTEIETASFGDAERRTTTRRYVSEVLAARVDEIAEMVAIEIERAGFTGRLPAGAVLVGGGTELAGIPRRLGARWDVPVRIGRPSKVVGLADATRGPAHAAAVGLLLWAASGASDAALSPRDAPAHTGAPGLARVADWFRQAFLPGGGRRRWEGGGG